MRRERPLGSFAFAIMPYPCALQTSLHWNDEKKNEIRQIEQRMIKNRSPNGAGLFIKIALRHAEEEKGNKGRVGEWLGDVVGGGKEFREHGCENDRACHSPFFAKRNLQR